MFDSTTPISKAKPKLSLNTSFNSPKMSQKGFIEPHASHLPRRIRNRTKTTPSLQLDLDQHATPSKVDPHPIPATQSKPQVSTHPHRDNLPRRTRLRERTKTAPTNIQPAPFPPPLPISSVVSQSTTGAETPPDPPKNQVQLSPNPPPFELNSKALSLISKAQNKAFKSRPSRILIDNDPDPQDTNHRPPLLSSPTPTSPQLPHPAMGLTMGIMEAYAREDEDDPAGVGNIMRPHAILRSGLSYSPALGVRGTPPAFPSSTFPDHTPVFVPAPAYNLNPTSTLNPMTTLNSTRIVNSTIPKTSTPIPALTPPVTAPLGQNLPRRHRHRRKVPQTGTRGSGSDAMQTLGGSGHVPEVLRVHVDHKKGNRIGNEEEDGLFSSLLDFEHAGSETGKEKMQIGQVEGKEQSSCRAVSDPSSRQGGKRRGEEDPRCIQVLGRSCVEVGHLLQSEIENGGDRVLVEVIDHDVGGEKDNKRSLELKLLETSREGIPSLLPEQLAQGCDFMKEWIGCEARKRKIRISVPRSRAQDAFGLAVCFLTWVEEQCQCLHQEQVQEHKCIVPIKVNDLACLEQGVYTPIHHLYMRLLDDGGGGCAKVERDVRGKGKGLNESSERVGLGIIGVRLGPEEVEKDIGEGGQSVHSDSTTGSSHPTSVKIENPGSGEGKRKGRRGYHVREAALGGSRISSHSSSSSPSQGSPCRQEKTLWKGLRDEWRGVLSYEGLNTLVGVWPHS